MISKLKIILVTLAFGLVFLTVACDEQSKTTTGNEPNVVAKKISQHGIAKTVKKENKTDKIMSENNLAAGVKKAESPDPKETDTGKGAHYDSQGKIDPFKPLIQEKSEDSKPIVDNRPKRILTPLEKIELSQIRLVGIIIMEKRRIALVEEANGKGYEVGIGTYIGKNQGRVSEIKSSSIVIKELVHDYKGRLKERVEEIKLHKIDNEE